MYAPRLFTLLLHINIAAVRHAFLSEVEIITFGIMGAVSSKGTVGRPLEHRDFRIIFLDTRHRFVDVVDIDAEMVQARYITRLSADHSHTDVTVADADGIIVPDRLLFLFGARFRPLHAEYGFIEFRFSHKVFTDDRRVLNFSWHENRLRSNC